MGFRFPAQLKDRLDRYCSDHGVDMTSLVVRLLTEFLDAEDKRSAVQVESF